ETFDFVQLPGIAHAVPKLVEDLQEDDKESDHSDGRDHQNDRSHEAQVDPNGDTVSDQSVRETAPPKVQELDQSPDDADAPAPVVVHNPPLTETRITEERLMDA